MHEKRRGCNQIIERRPVLVVAIAYAQMSRASRRRHACDGFCAERLGSSGDRAALPLLQSIVDAKGVIGIGERSVDGLHANEPCTLQQIDEQKRSRDELRAANRIGIDNSAYQGQTECFTMAETMMDSNLPPTTIPPRDPSSPPTDASPAARSSTLPLSSFDAAGFGTARFDTGRSRPRNGLGRLSRKSSAVQTGFIPAHAG